MNCLTDILSHIVIKLKFKFEMQDLDALFLFKAVDDDYENRLNLKYLRGLAHNLAFQI